METEKRHTKTWMDDASVLDAELIDIICARVASGESISAILEEPEMPSTYAFYRWLQENPKFKSQYWDAVEMRMHYLGEQAMNIADDCHPKMVKKAELQQKARWWLAERLNRRQYGDNKTLEINGNVEVKHSIHELLTDGTENAFVVDVTPQPKEIEHAPEETCESTDTKETSGSNAKQAEAS